MTPDTAEPHTEAINATADTAPTPDAAASNGDISVRDAVRRAVGELGADAELDDVLADLQGQFGLTPPRGTIQTYLCNVRKDARDAALSEPRRRGRPRKTAVNGQAAPTPTPAVEEVIDAVEVLRELRDRLGPDNLHRLLDAL